MNGYRCKRVKMTAPVDSFNQYQITPQRDFDKIIVKVRHPMFTNNPTAQVLLYNQDKSFIQEWDLDAGLLSTFPDNCFKYFATLSCKNNQFHLHRIDEDPGW